MQAVCGSCSVAPHVCDAFPLCVHCIHIEFRVRVGAQGHRAEGAEQQASGLRGQGSKGSGVRGVPGSRVQWLRGSRAEGFKG
eukprot:15470808-Alexandrium_andersonii.AAC.1